MAKVNLSGLPVQLNNTMRLDRVPCDFRCTKEEFGNSKAGGNPMFTRRWEVISPETIKLPGVDSPVLLAGTEVVQYLPLKNVKEPEKTTAMLMRFKQEQIKLGLNADDIDDENPALECEGVVARGEITSEERTAMTRPTPEEVANGVKPQPILNEDGTEKKVYYPKLRAIYGKSEANINKQFA